MKPNLIQEWPTYGMDLPLGFNIVEFTRNAQGGVGRFWLLCLDDEPGIRRYKGIVIQENVRVFIDILSHHQSSKNVSRHLYVTTPWYQNLTALEVAKIVRDELNKGANIYHEDKVVPE